MTATWFALEPKKNSLRIDARSDAGVHTINSLQASMKDLPDAVQSVASRLISCINARGITEADEGVILEGPKGYAELRLLDVLSELQRKKQDAVQGLAVRLPVKGYIDVHPDDPERLGLFASYDDQLTHLRDDKTSLFGDDPIWVLNTENDVLHSLHITHPRVLAPLAKRCDAAIPANHARTLLSEMYHDTGTLGWVPVKAMSRFRTIELEPKPRLYVKDEKDVVRFDLKFAYGEWEVPPDGQANRYVYRQQVLLRIPRNVEEERRAIDALGTTGMKKEDGRFWHEDPIGFLASGCRDLLRDGFEIYGREALLGGQVVESRPKVKVGVSQNADWLDLKIQVKYDDTNVPVEHLVETLLAGDRFIRLADGRVAALPAKWTERLATIVGLAQTTEDGLRVNKAQHAIVETVLEESVEQDVQVDLSKLRRGIEALAQPPTAPLPMRFRGELRPYQREGYNWLYALKQQGFGGILADDMGLGKTVQMLCLLCKVHEDNPDAKSLVVVPTSLMHNWKQEGQTFAPHLKMYVHHGTARSIHEWNEHDIIITSYNTLRNDIEQIMQKKLACIVLDESQHIKNPASQASKAIRELKAPLRIAMTGTPVENSTLELWSQMSFANPGLLGPLSSFSSTYARRIDERMDQARASALRALCAPFIIRRTKQAVAKDLPEKQISVVRCEMQPEQHDLYMALHKRVREDIIDLLDGPQEQGMQVKMLQGLLRLRQLANHPLLVHSGFLGESGKFTTLIDMLDEAVQEGHKALVFSTFLGLLDMAGEELTKKGIKHIRLDGSTSNRQELVNQFQEDDDTKVFLISLKAGGVGLTLTAADYVFILDPWWNPAIEMQAIDRAHRIGQQNPVFVYKLISEGTVEEKILALQEKKRQLVENLIVEEEGIAKRLSDEDLRYLLD